MKRLFDIIASGCGLLVLSPVFLIFAVWIKLDSDGLCSIIRCVWADSTTLSASTSSDR